jgi:hypothetical protein
MSGFINRIASPLIGFVPSPTHLTDMRVPSAIGSSDVSTVAFSPPPVISDT